MRYDYPWHDILATGKDHYIFLDVDKYTIPTDYKLSYFSGPESKTVEKAKFKKKYTGSTFGVSDSYTYKIKPNYKTKIKVQITGKNVVVTLNNKKIKCKKKVTKTLWVEPAGGGICPGTDLYVNVYKKGLKYDVFNENGTDYSIKITKLKVKK